MKNQIETWLNFLAMSLSLFTVSNRTSVLHPTHTPCPNTAGDIVFELNRNFNLYLKMVTDRYRQHSDSSGDEGELDFLFITINARQDQGLSSHLWILPITEVERTTVDERMLFVCSELSRAVDYLRDFFGEFYDPKTPPWYEDQRPVMVTEQSPPWDVPGAVLDSVPDFTHPKD